MYSKNIASERLSSQAKDLKFAVYSNMSQIYIIQEKYDRGLSVYPFHHIVCKKQGKSQQTPNSTTAEPSVSCDHRNSTKQDQISQPSLTWTKHTDSKDKIWWTRWQFSRNNRKTNLKPCTKSFSNDLSYLLTQFLLSHSHLLLLYLHLFS